MFRMLLDVSALYFVALRIFFPGRSCPAGLLIFGNFLFLSCACIVLVVVDQDRSRGFPAVSEFITGDLSPLLPPLIVLFVL